MEQQVVIGVEQLRQAFASTRAILEEVRRDQLGLPTPCASWDVAALINHFVGTARWAASTVSAEDGPADWDFAAGDFVAAYDDSIEMVLAAFRVDGVLDGEFVLPFGAYSGARMLSLTVREQFIHGWDLARSIGRPANLLPELATDLLSDARVEITDELRGPDTVAFFGPAVDAGDDACPADRLATFLGRSI